MKDLSMDIIFKFTREDGTEVDMDISDLSNLSYQEAKGLNDKMFGLWDDLNTADVKLSVAVCNYMTRIEDDLEILLKGLMGSFAKEELDAIFG